MERRNVQTESIMATLMDTKSEKNLRRVVLSCHYICVGCLTL